MNPARILQFIVIGNALLLIVQAVRVISVYGAVYSLTTDKKKAQLPLHVWLIAVSYLIYVVSTTYFLYTLGLTVQGVTRAIIYGTGGVFGQFALWNVLSYERRRYSAATNFLDHEDHA